MVIANLLVELHLHFLVKLDSPQKFHVVHWLGNHRTTLVGLKKGTTTYWCVLRKEFSGMIHNHYSNNHPSNPQQPIQQPYVKRTSKNRKRSIAMFDFPGALNGLVLLRMFEKNMQETIFDHLCCHQISGFPVSCPQFYQLRDFPSGKST